MGDQSNNTTSAISLDYAAKPNPWQKRGRWAGRLLLLAGLIFAGWRWGPPVWQKAMLLYWQRRCMAYSAPPDTVVYEANRSSAQALLQQREYISAEIIHEESILHIGPQTIPTIAAHRPAAWDAMIDRGILQLRSRSSGSPKGAAICFLGELKTPSGESRLVIVESLTFRTHAPGMEEVSFSAYTLSPATVFQSTGKAIKSPGSSGLRTDGSDRPQNARIFAGQRDPNDPSRFTIRYQTYGQENIVDGSIDNSGLVKMLWRQPLPRPIAPTTRNSQ